MLDTSTPEQKSELLKTYEFLEGKSSTSPDRAGSGGAETAAEKVCFLRAGSGALGRGCREMQGAVHKKGVGRERGMRGDER